jgi:uncharacterized protein
MTNTDVPGLPFKLDMTSVWEVSEVVSTTALPKSDIFIDPAGLAPATHNAATLLGDPPAGDFQFSARVEVDFNSDFDAGVLLLWIDETHWGKLCFEYSPDGQPMVVSVICREVADDSNAFVVEGDSVWLRVSRVGDAFAYHASTDGQKWRMIRYFSLPGAVRVGFEAQAPTGPGCEVRFDEIRYQQERLADLRNGS